ncbi:tRNA Delta(2)-isopentenylpyrophosphate transferase [Acidiphilium sp. PM]|nr:tRNA Delta(2)-isopentenylpyrophosphate transferase [Acidiphilium sp. PM]
MCRNCWRIVAGAISLDEAASRAIAATAAYTKRQATWFRHQKLADQRNTHTIRSRFTDSAQFSESTVRSIISFINLSS